MYTGKFANGIIKANPGWFKPQKFITSFTGKYTQTIAKNMSIQAAGGIIAEPVFNVPEVKSYKAVPPVENHKTLTIPIITTLLKYKTFLNISSGSGYGGGASIGGGSFGGGGGGGSF